VLYTGAERGRNRQGVKGIKGGGMARGLGEKRPGLEDDVLALTGGARCQ
jgi:hypothetical protein